MPKSLKPGQASVSLSYTDAPPKNPVDARRWIQEAVRSGRYTATVKVIDRVMDAASGTFGVRMELPNPGLKLPAGIRCKASVPGVTGRTVLAAPARKPAAVTAPVAPAAH